MLIAHFCRKMYVLVWVSFQQKPLTMLIYVYCHLVLIGYLAISIDGTYQLYGITRQGECKQKIVAYTLDIGDDFDIWWRWEKMWQMSGVFITNN